ncbi:uncharacterized protein LOC120905170 isoform X1 [Anopheles arabiensis]|uniref:uncharacterized protein LOC120905170 isoform X1 n=1 Tax=Anopheles arabiensis TaxID=7173 RepID=UPI001AAC6154|nr:uncharacterized protein LOC120905170 isoform X1 [Anopheles arabiensis]
MDKYLRFFIKFQPYMIVLFTLQMVMVLTPAMAQTETDGIENLRFGGKVAVVFGFSWALAVVALITAIHKEDKRLIYPYACLFGFELLLLVLREFYIIAVHGFFIEVLTIKMYVAALGKWHFHAPVTCPWLHFRLIVEHFPVVPYVCASLFALHRLFTVDPIETRRDEGFVRFDRNEMAAVAESQISSSTISPVPNHNTPQVV